MAFGDRKLGMLVGGKVKTTGVFDLPSDHGSFHPLIVNGIFDVPYLDAKMGQQELNTRAPRFVCIDSEVDAVKLDTPVTINGRRYYVNDIDPEGTGTTTLHLSLMPNGD